MLLAAVACFLAAAILATSANSSQPLENTVANDDGTLSNGAGQLPAMFDFGAYKRKYNKHYASADEELRRKALFLASCLRVLPT